jgi:hypothetical protein
VAQSTAASTQAHNSAAYRELDDCHAGTVLPLYAHQSSRNLNMYDY